MGQTKDPKSYDFGDKKGGFNILNIPDNVAKNFEGAFWDSYNRPFLDDAISRGDDIALATIPKAESKSDHYCEW